MQQQTLVRVVQSLRNGSDDPDHLVWRHAVGVALLKKSSGVGALHVVHRDPQLVVELASVVDTDDVRVPQTGGDVGFTIEPLPVFRVVGESGGQYLQRVVAGQAGVLG